MRALPGNASGSATYYQGMGRTTRGDETPDIYGSPGVSHYRQILIILLLIIYPIDFAVPGYGIW
jgi:hypothetical protein